jgi:hypothetical protein
LFAQQLKIEYFDSEGMRNKIGEIVVGDKSIVSSAFFNKNKITSVQEDINKDSLTLLATVDLYAGIAVHNTYKASYVWTKNGMKISKTYIKRVINGVDKESGNTIDEELAFSYDSSIKAINDGYLFDLGDSLFSVRIRVDNKEYKHMFYACDNSGCSSWLDPASINRYSFNKLKNGLFKISYEQQMEDGSYVANPKKTIYIRITGNLLSNNVTKIIINFRLLEVIMPIEYFLPVITGFVVEDNR